MRNGLRVITGALALCLALNAAASAACVSDPTFGAPSVSGAVGGTPVTVVYDYSGGNGGAFGVTAFWLTAGGNGYLTAQKKIHVLQAGDRMTAFFRGGRLYLANAIYLNGEAHCCYTHLAVQRFTMDLRDHDHPQLVAAGIGVVAEPKAPSYGECPNGQEDSRYRDYFEGPWKNAVAGAVH